MTGQITLETLFWLQDQASKHNHESPESCRDGSRLSATPSGSHVRSWRRRTFRLINKLLFVSSRLMSSPALSRVPASVCGAIFQIPSRS